MRAFTRTIGIDYSGAETPTASLKGLRVYMVEGDGHPVEVPPPSTKKYWMWRGIAEWLADNHDIDAPIQAAMRADRLLAAGDIEGQRVWQRIIKAIDALQSEGIPEDAIHH